MERNTLLAIVLSVAVLFIYQAIFVAPKQEELLKNSQHTAPQIFTEINNSSSATISNNSTEPTKISNKPILCELYTTENDISYTNMGGSLYNVNFFKNKLFPITDVLNISGFENTQFTGKKLDDKTVLFFYNDKTWQITKTFKIEDKNLIKARLEIKNVSLISSLEDFIYTAFEIDESRMEYNQNNRDNALLEYSVYTKNKIFRKGNATRFGDKNNKSESVIVNWIGFRDHYNAFIVKPEFETKSYEVKSDSDKQLNISIKTQDKDLAPGETVTYDFSIYAGPQNPSVMKKYNEGFEKIVAFSNFLPIEWIGQGIFRIIPILHNIFKSWGVAIILVSIMIYGITYPLSLKSMMSMRKMQEVQPKIKALQERYKNDPQKLNAEMVEIYRREKINPFGGCLPMFIQMPFFMALYQILWRAQYLQGQRFLWIKDLSQPDHLMLLPFSLPFSLGNYFNILPLLTGSIMFMQQKMSSKNMVVADEQQAMQQKMMMFLLPIMMTFVFYNFASSWAIYFLVYYILTTATQWKIAQTAGKKVS